MRIAIFSIAWMIASTLVASEPPEPIYTQKTSFKIPFQIEPPTRPSEVPKQVELWVSYDHYQWQRHAVVEPSAKRFEFQAPSDGEFWFVIRTINAEGQRLPPANGPTVPEMKVVVDSAAPNLVLQGHAGRAGEIVLNWQARDANLAVDRPKLEFRPADGPKGAWRKIAIDPGWEGQTTLPPQKGPILIRGQIADRSGKSAEVELKIDSRTQRPVIARSVPKAGPTEDVPGNPREDGNIAPVGYDVVSKEQTPSKPDAAAMQPAKQPKQEPDDRYAGHPAFMTAAQQEQAEEAAAPSPEPEDRYAHLNPPQPEETKTEDIPPPPEKAPQPEVPADAQVFPINSLSFELDYDVRGVGPSGVSKVEVWGTTDGGKNWQLYAVDQDRSSPVQVAVTAEAVYGFHIVVQSAGGFGQRPPQAGDLPKIWVAVDTTSPQARLLRIANAAQQPNGELLIEWEARDRELADKPISLQWSYSPNGPWYPLASGLENLGQYRWQPVQPGQRPIHLRMEVRDAAGNTTMINSSQGMVADRNSKQFPEVRRPQGQPRSMPRRTFR